MSEGFMIDPITPGANNNNPNSSRATNPGYPQPNNGSSAGKIIFVVLFCFFVLPFIICALIFFTIWGDVKDEIKEGIEQENSAVSKHANDYELSSSERTYAIKVWSFVHSTNEAKAGTISRSYCQVLKNISTNFTNKNKTAQIWFDATFCESNNVNMKTDILITNSTANGGMRLMLQDFTRPASTCVMMDFEEDFQYLTHVTSATKCLNMPAYTLKDDSKHVTEVQPLYGSKLPVDDDDDTSTQQKNNAVRS